MNADLFQLHLGADINESHIMLMHWVTTDITYLEYDMEIASLHIREDILRFAERTGKMSTINFLQMKWNTSTLLKWDFQSRKDSRPGRNSKEHDY